MNMQAIEEIVGQGMLKLNSNCSPAKVLAPLSIKIRAIINKLPLVPEYD
jgi:hypothetical protein